MRTEIRRTLDVTHRLAFDDDGGNNECVSVGMRLCCRVRPEVEFSGDVNRC